MLMLPDSWVWDFWTVDDGRRYHIFFLFASRALGDPELRHRRASIGHAVSRDLVSWQRMPDAVVAGDPSAFDELATWTGSVIRAPEGSWYLFYTGARVTSLGLQQTVGYATSDDLIRWVKQPGNPVLCADPRWYQTLASRTDGDGEADEACRDPWLFADPGGSGWHMLLTVHAADGPERDRGVVGHATSPDLRRWTMQPPLTRPGQGFSQLEVMQVESVQGRNVLVFSCFGADTAPARAATGIRSGVWAAAAASPTGPFDLENAYPLTDESEYSGRLVKQRETGDWQLLTFQHRTVDGLFGGFINDPRPVRWGRDGRLAVEGR